MLPLPLALWGSGRGSLAHRAAATAPGSQGGFAAPQLWVGQSPSPVPQQGRVVKLNQEQAAFPEGIPAAGTLLGPLGSCQVLEFYLLFRQGWH